MFRVERGPSGGVGCAVLYVAGAFVSKVIASQGIQRSLVAARIAETQAFCTPTPFNSLLWYVVAKDGLGYHVGYRSVFEKPHQRTEFTFFSQRKSLLTRGIPSAEVDRLVQFADGYYVVEPTGHGLAIDVLRFGQVGGWQQPRAPFVFRYQLNDETANRLVVQRGRFEGWTRPTTIAYIKRIVNQP
ncbi:hypothetical protein J2I47_07495 [Fibrella sp. HMF5335]|uniref:Uncharacterized protein n=1 Tax=Fibrella rubiginis TaxID=2817060 RepID=A0A939GFP5_9BACT|nr:hypothetical protein [Fibrella rubiginis]MBO0936389.1 hypothetical protein [Fibrella rubiginis]